MATKEEQELRDFIHTVDVLTASALAERELAEGLRPTGDARLVRRPYLAFAAAAGLALAIGLPVYLLMPTMQSRDVQRQIAMAPPAPSAAPEAESRRREEKTSTTRAEEVRTA